MKRVLIIEDDEEIVELLAIHLRDLHCVINKSYTGEDGLKNATVNEFDLIILDVMLPGIDGMEVCRVLRAKNVATPILMLTAKSEEIDKILGLEIGADDYLTKPFSVREFIARVKAIFRRTKLDKQLAQPIEKKEENVLCYNELCIDNNKRKVVIKGKRIDLTPKEFDLLYLLATNPGKSYSRQRLLSLIWGYEYNGYEHTVNAHINRLRTKIEPDLSKPTYILTTWGIGYRFTDEE